MGARRPADPGAGGRRRAWIAVLIAVAAVAWLARAIQHRKVELPGYSHWVTTDADSLHQLRRIERIFREGPPAAEFDAELSWPEGSAIPAPPYYPLVAWTLLAPFAPREVEARRGWLEERACTLPAVFGVLAALVAAWAALELAGIAAALFAGLCVAVAPGAIHYSCVGNGDYQSWSLLLGLVQLALLASAFERGVLERRRPALTWGAALGALHGLAIGSWTPALIQLVLADATLGLAIAVHARSGRFAALPHFGLALHGAALAVLAPAIASSPWRASAPWQVVNLSWFHAAFLALGAAVFVPLFVVRPRTYPWLVAAALAALGALAWLAQVGPGAGLREAFSWARAENVFMAQVAESAPLVGAGSASKLVLYLGYGAPLAPLAALGLGWLAWSERRLAWALWGLALLVFGAMAAAQLRFAELAVAPLAIGLVALLRAAWARTGFARWPIWATVGLAACAALALHGIGVASTVRRAQSGRPFTDSLAKRSARVLSDWLRLNSPPRSGVMADWSHGQLIQWAAERPVVAANYGHYTGAAAFLDALAFFAQEDPARAEALLERRSVRYVLVTSDLDRVWPSIASALELPADPARFATSLGARLLGAGQPPDFLRLVHCAPFPDPRRARPGGGPPPPSGFVYERVAGAWIEARGEPGALLELTAPLRAGERSFTYAAAVRADPQGQARLRMPYATERAGDVEPAGPFQVRFAGTERTVAIRDAEVQAGSVIPLP
jgi:asparagine N-glycosylation enzyme membrane subunit Stt3